MNLAHGGGDSFWYLALILHDTHTAYPHAVEIDFGLINQCFWRFIH